MIHVLFQNRNAVIVDQTSEAEAVHEDDADSTGDHIDDEEGSFKEDTERECLIKHDKEEDDDGVNSTHDNDNNKHNEREATIKHNDHEVISKHDYDNGIIKNNDADVVSTDNDHDANEHNSNIIDEDHISNHDEIMMDDDVANKLENYIVDNGVEPADQNDFIEPELSSCTMSDDQQLAAGLEARERLINPQAAETENMLKDSSSANTGIDQGNAFTS